jgi:hypothetical protein
MGLFSKAGPLDPMFTLPPVRKMECTQLNFPCKSEMAMMNFKWIDKQMSTGKYQDPVVMVNRIMESSEFWQHVEVVDLNQATQKLVQYVIGLESLTLNEDDYTELYMAANFGLLAGLFESSSKTTDKGACHPEIWNAMSRLSSLRRDDRGGEKMEEKEFAFMFLCQKTTEAGYVMGKLGGLTMAEVFKRWNALR